MFAIEDIKVVHLEITEVCQAACPMCPRYTYTGEINPHLQMRELTLADCMKIFSPKFISQLDKMYMCGNFGDPAAAKGTIEVFRYFRQHNPTMMLEMHTNGGLRNSQWWTELATVLAPAGQVKFGVDGLQDTNHIYRRNVEWSKVERNIKTFTNAGGKALWYFLVFAHNEHQLDAARALSVELGCADIRFKKSNRFNQNSTGDPLLRVNPSDNLTINPPTNAAYVNAGLSVKAALVEQYGSIVNFNKFTPITCKATRDKTIFISAEGLFFPCCYLASSLYWVNNHEEMNKFVESIGGKMLIDARQGLEAMFETNYLKLIAAGWDNPDTRLTECGANCNSTIDLHRLQVS